MHGFSSLSRYISALALVAAATLVCEVLRSYFSPVNMVMAYLLAVVVAAVSLGRWPAIVAALFGVVSFDFFFVPPRFSFSVADKEYLLTFFALFVVGMVISALVARAREQAETLRIRGEETAALYRLSRDLSTVAELDGVLRGAVGSLEENLHVTVAIWMQGDDGLEMVVSSVGLHPDNADHEAAGWSFLSQRSSGLGTDMFVAASMLHLPLKSAAMVEGVLSVAPADGLPVPEGKRRTLETCAAHIAMALERARLASAAEEARLLKARETLERALLNSISHDLRTPLVSVTGVLSSLRDEGAVLDEHARQELLETACGEAERLNRFVGNLLDMTRLEAGAVRLTLEPCDAQELVGCALSAMEQRLGERRVEVTLAPDLPLVPMDLVLMIQVLVNLLDNAHKHAPRGSDITIAGRVENPWLVMEIVDRGPGVAEKDLERIFDKFYRIPVPEGAGGTGLGLSICKGIIEAHGGRIRAENLAGGGFCMEVRLPLAVEGSSDDAGT